MRENNEIREQRKELDSKKADAAKILETMKLNGFQTEPGSNTHLLANIMVDYVDRIAQTRREHITQSTIWGTNDLTLMANVLFWRYRIYNERHHPKLFDISEIGDSAQIGEPLRLYRHLVKISESLAAEAGIESFMISSPNPTTLGVQYKDVMSLCFAEAGGQTLKESKTSISGKYLEGDFLLLPNEAGYATFYPLKAINETVKLKLLVKKSPQQCNLPVVKDSVEVDCDFLRFVLSNLLAKFAVFQGMQPQEIQDYISMKYHLESLLDATALILAPTYAGTLKEIKTFVDENSATDLRVQEAEELKVGIEVSGSLDFNEFVEFLNPRISGIFKKEEVKELLYKIIDDFFVLKFGIDANTAKIDNKISLKFPNFNEIGDYVVVSA